MILYLLFMFGATGRGDDMGVTTGLPPPKPNILYITKSDDPCMGELCVGLGHKCINVTITNIQYIYIIEYQ